MGVIGSAKEERVRPRAQVSGVSESWRVEDAGLSQAETRAVSRGDGGRGRP